MQLLEVEECIVSWIAVVSTKYKINALLIYLREAPVDRSAMMLAFPWSPRWLRER